jgi:predicted GIY-YIG superfamily endonuclease
MLHTYILRTESTGRPCIGSSSDLRRRIDEHIGGLPMATRNRGPGRLVQAMVNRQSVASPLVAQLSKSDRREQGVFGFHQGCSYAGLPSRFAPSIVGSRSSPIRKRFLRPTPGQEVLAGL